MKTSLAFAVLLLVVAAQAEVQCSKVVDELMPCLGFLRNRSDSDACCHSITTLLETLDSRQERQEACLCLRSAFIQYNLRVRDGMAIADECRPYIRTNRPDDVELLNRLPDAIQCFA